MRFGTKDEVEGMRPCRKTAIAHAKRMDESFEVETLEGTMAGQAGDYLMRGVEGELYPCAASVFDSSYTWAPERIVRADEYRCSECSRVVPVDRSGGLATWDCCGGFAMNVD